MLSHATVSTVLLAACATPEVTAVPETASLARSAGGSSFEVVLDRPLPQELRWAWDVRWASDQSVWLAAARSGVFELSIEGPETSPRRLGAGGDGPDGLELATSDGVVAAAIGYGEVSWRSTEPRAVTERAAPLAILVDFDLRDGEAVFLGARRTDDGAVEDSIVWHGSVKRRFEDLSPRMAPPDPSALDVGRCGLFELGAIRYLEDGSYAVVPGFVPGAFLYDRSGALRHAWDTTALGIYDQCDVDWEQSALLMRDPDARRSWVHGRSVLDDIVPWGRWLALIVRRPRPDGTSWQLVVLSDRGVSPPVDLPVRTGSTGSHLRGDVRGDRLALVVSEFGGLEQPPLGPPRLIVLVRSPEPSAPGGTEGAE